MKKRASIQSGQLSQLQRFFIQIKRTLPGNQLFLSTKTKELFHYTYANILLHTKFFGFLACILACTSLKAIALITCRNRDPINNKGWRTFYKLLLSQLLLPAQGCSRYTNQGAIAAYLEKLCICALALGRSVGERASARASCAQS